MFPYKCQYYYFLKAFFYLVSQGDQEDAFLLHIVEGYSSTALPLKRAGNGTQSLFVHEYDAPQLIVAENEKMFVEEMIGDQVVVKEK